MIKEKIKKWLEKVAKENKEQFGYRRLDCCDLNRNRGLITVKKNTGKN